MSRVEVARFFERHPPFSHLEKDHIARLAERVRLEEYTSDTVILRQSAEPSPALFVVRRGAVDVFRELWRVRLEHHADRLEQTAAADDLVRPSALTEVTRRALIGAFHSIATEQRALARWAAA